MKKINFLVLIIFITGCTSCDKLSEVLDDNPDMPETIEVEKVDDNLEDVIFSEGIGRLSIVGINIKTEKVYKMDLEGFQCYNSLFTFEGGALVHLDRGSFSKKGLYRYFPKEGLLKKIDLKTNIRGFIRIDEDKVWIGSSEKGDQTSTVGIYSIRENKILEYKTIPYYINILANTGNLTKINGKTYIPVRTDAGESGGGLYCIEDDRLIHLSVLDGGGVKSPISGIIEKTSKIDTAYRIKSVEPLELEYLYSFHIDYNLWYIYIYEIGDKYFLLSAGGNTGIMNKHTYKIDTIVNNFPKDENSTTGYGGTFSFYYRDGYIWTFGDDDTEICRLDPITLEIKRIRY